MDNPLNPQPIIDNQQSKNQKQNDQNDIQDDMKGQGQSSRRSRKDIQGRDFVCGCGKKYLSYPALYTHIKTKHDGRQPQGTMKYSTVAPAKKTKTKLEEQHLNQMYSLIAREDIKLLDLLSQKFIGMTPLSSRLKSKILQKQLTDAYHSLLKTPTSPLKIGKDSPLQHHLIAYLIGIGEYVPQKLHEHYQWFARTAKECYYTMGQEVYGKCFNKIQGGLCYIPNFKVQKVKYFPLICDFYIRFFLPYEYTQLNVNLMQLILTDFCTWLSKRKCTFIEIFLNKQYKLNAPLQFQQQLRDQQSKKQEQQQKQPRSQLQDIQSSNHQNNRSVQQQNQNQSQNKNQDNQHRDLESIDSEMHKNSKSNRQKVEPAHQSQAQAAEQNQQNGEKAKNLQNEQNAENIKNLENGENGEVLEKAANPQNYQQIRQNCQNIQNAQAQGEQANKQQQKQGQMSISYHRNLSMQVQPASQSSQQLSAAPMAQHENNFESDVPPQQNMEQNNEDQPEAVSQQL